MCLRYPFEPPNIRFLTPIYHPNIDNSGRICHDALKLPPKVVKSIVLYFVFAVNYLSFYSQIRRNNLLGFFLFVFIQGAWKPSLNISTVLTSIQLLMAEPNPDDPLMADIVSCTHSYFRFPSAVYFYVFELLH